MAGCDDTRQITEAQRQAGYQSQRTGVQRAVRPFTGRPTVENLIDYINRELFPAVRSTRDRVNDIYLPVVDNAPSANPLGFFFSDSIVNADPTAGRIRLNAATQDTATVIRVSENNGRLTDVAPWLDVMSGSVTSPLGVVTLFDAVNPARFIRFDLSSMSDAGTYWNLTVVPVESSHDNPFVDGEPVSLSFIPGVGGGTPATIPPTAISGADGPRQFLSTSTGTVVDWRTLSATFPGAPIYDVMAYPFNAAGDGVIDDTTAINAAIAAANTTPGWIYLGQRHRITAALTTVSGNNILILGRGDFNGGSRIIVDSAAAIDVLTFTGQYSGVQDVWIVGIRVYTSGWAIRVRNAFRVRISRCVISQLCFGVEVFRSVLTYLDKVNIDDIYGVFAFWAGGDSGGENHAVTFRSCTAGVSMPGSIVGAASAWAAGTAYAVGKVVVANSGLYQAVQAGTSAGAGTGPSGIPGATNATVHTAQITDGTVKWVFAMPAFVGFLQDSYCHTFEMIDCGVLQGLYGFSMEDSANTGSSYPQFARARNLQVDHPMSRGVRLAAGGAARFDSTFVTSVFGGVGIEVGSSFKGNWEFIGGEVFGCSEAGVVINKGDGEINGLQIGACGSISSNTRDCIEVGSSASRWSVVGCSAGQMFAGTSPATRYGISVAAGCDNYVIEGNRFTGNVTGGILNTPGRSSTRAVLNNIPGVTITAGSSWGLQVDATSPAVPVEITGAEQAENWRRATIQTVSGVSGTLDILLNDDTTVLLIRTTADATLRTLGNNAVGGDGREIVIEHDRLSGTGNLTIAHNTAGTYVAFFNPNTASIVLGQTTCLQIRARSGFWRPQGSAGSRIADADYGDITVSGAGTVWTIDNNVVTDAKLRDSVGFSVLGRAGTGTGDPADIVIADNSVIGRAGVSGTGDIEAITVPGTGTLTGESVFLQSSSLRNHVRWGNITLAALPTMGDLKFVGNVSGATARPAYVDIAQLAQDLFGIGFDTATHNFRLTDMAQSRIKGRAEGAGTGVPTDLTPTQVVSIIDGETVTWTGSHTFNGTNFTVAAGADVSILATAGTVVLAAGTQVQITSPARLASSIVQDSVVTSSATAANNLVIGSVSIVRFTGPVNPLTGMVPVDNGQVVYLVNAHATDDAVIQLNSPSSSAANRFAGLVTDRHIKPGEMGMAWYDGSSSLWRLLVRDDVDL